MSNQKGKSHNYPAYTADLTGDRLGDLLQFHGKVKNKRGYSLWKCKCDCGNTGIFVGANLGTRRKSCGCLLKEVNSKIHRTHGESKSREFKTWVLMRQRCSNPNSFGFSDYGGRNIKVCKRWLKFDNFLADMGRRPSPKHSIDRVDVNGDYEPSNCRWATKKEQGNNTRVNVLLALNGKTQTMTQWAEHLGFKVATLWRRLQLGWTIEKTLTMPVS